MLDFDVNCTINFAITCFALFEIHALSWRSAEPTSAGMLVTSGDLTELNSAKSTQTSHKHKQTQTQTQTNQH